MILDELVAEARHIVEGRVVSLPAEALRERALATPTPLDMIEYLKCPGVSIIAEVKRASPSRGALNVDLDPAQLAATYAQAGADAISVLTEPTRFLGQLSDLSEARQALAAMDERRPLLRKDFIVDPYQLLEARAWGADAVLLIIAALMDDDLTTLYEGALALGLTPLVEVHNAEELARAIPLQPVLVGINNRDLRDFTVDLNTTRRLREQVPPQCAMISESGIHEPEQMRLLAELAVDAALIGEALVTAPDPMARLRALKEAGR